MLQDVAPFGEQIFQVTPIVQTDLEGDPHGVIDYLRIMQNMALEWPLPFLIVVKD